ncbi:MAG: hypothetical protein QOJ08_1150 [Ilumatobacteraceae bacterium]
MRNVVRSVVSLAAVTCCAATACSDNTPPATDGQYCAEVTANLDQLNAPAIADAAGIDDATKLYRSITSIAPLAVQKEWATMTSNVEAAAAVDPNDPASVQKVADMARSSQHAASSIADYTSKVCGVTLGIPVTTLPPVVETGGPP